MDPLTALVFGGYIALQVYSWNKTRKYTRQKYSKEQAIEIPQKIITFVGATSSGKSSTINALTGLSTLMTDATHSTTNQITEVMYKDGYKLRDTPGFLDAPRFKEYMWPILCESSLIVFVATGQLYRPELDLLTEIHHRQQLWDNQSNTSSRRKIILYINKQDIWEQTMTQSAREQIKATIKSQVALIVSTENIIYGSSAPVTNTIPQSPCIDELRANIAQNISQLD